MEPTQGRHVRPETLWTRRREYLARLMNDPRYAYEGARGKHQKRTPGECLAALGQAAMDATRAMPGKGAA